MLILVCGVGIIRMARIGLHVTIVGGRVVCYVQAVAIKSQKNLEVTTPEGRRGRGEGEKSNMHCIFRGK